MFIRIIGIRRCISSTVAQSRIPELIPRPAVGLRKTALTAPDSSRKEYTADQYQDFLRFAFCDRILIFYKYCYGSDILE